MDFISYKWLYLPSFSELAHSAVSPQARDMLIEDGTSGEERRSKEQQHIFGEIVKVSISR